jgi:cell shape-determining protein MreC
MKTTFFIAVSVIAFALGNVAHSQAPTAPQTALQRLDAIRNKNKQLLEKQAETLKLLDDLQLQSQQLKFLGKRS